MSELKEKLLFLTAAIRGTDTEDIVETLIDDVCALREACKGVAVTRVLDALTASDARLKRILGE